MKQGAKKPKHVATRTVLLSVIGSMVLGHTVAFVVRKGALTSDRHPAYGNNSTLTREDAAEILGIKIMENFVQKLKI